MAQKRMESTILKEIEMSLNKYSSRAIPVRGLKQGDF